MVHYVDADGRLEGLSELVNHGTEGDSLEIRPEEFGEEDSSDKFCYSVSVPLSVRAHFTRGLPQHRLSIIGMGRRLLGIVWRVSCMGWQ
jgi:hypothetical protein